MLPNPCLVNGTLADAVAALAVRAVEIRHGGPRLEKTAMEKTAILEQLGQSFQGLDPSIKRGLIGAGVGAGVGGLSSLFSDEEDRKPIQSALMGGLAGGALGYGSGLMSKHPIGDPPKPDAQGRMPLPEGQFYGPKGQAMRLKPGAKPTPEQAAQMKQWQESQEDGGVTGALNTVGKGMWDVGKNNPLTVAATAGAGINAVRPGHTMPAAESQTASHMRKGLASAATDQDFLPHLLRGEQTAQLRPVANPQAGQPPYEAVMGNPELAGAERYMQRLGVGARRGAQGPERDLFHGAVHREGLTNVQHDIADQLARRGALSELGKDLKGAEPMVRDSLFHRVTHGRLGDPHITVGSARDRIGQGLKGALTVGAGMAGDYAWRSLRDKYLAHRGINQTLDQFAEPVQ